MPTRLPLFVIDDQVILPGMVVPIELDDDSQAAIDAAVAEADDTLLVAPRLEDRYPAYAVIATIIQRGRTPSGEPAVVVRGQSRARLGQGDGGEGGALWMEVEPIKVAVPDEETTALASEYRALLVAYLQRRNAWQIIESVNRVNEPSALADLAGYASYLSTAEKRDLLETLDTRERLTKLIARLRQHIAEAELSDKIASDVREGVDKTQREYLLRQQLAAIRKELGDESEGADDYRARVEAADLPEKVREQALREVGKLERSSDQSPEAGYLRTWLDTVLELPWGVTSDDSTDLAAARAILDADHHGLEDVKERITEYLAVRARRAQRGLQVVGGRGSGAVLALVGPPGVGKTSLGESVARALGRTFVRVALGGVRDEAEIRGHRRTYVGALPGRIVRAIGEAGSMNPVVLLDEIDKVGSDYRGDPAAALLEVLDPAQNHTFRDHYLDLDLDLSDVVFLATANVVESIPQPLLDRMELVTLDGYTSDDKVAIARDFLLPRQLERAALSADEVELTDDALRFLASDYTREPGVRQLERFVAKVLRKVATKLPIEGAQMHAGATGADVTDLPTEGGAVDVTAAPDESTPDPVIGPVPEDTSPSTVPKVTIDEGDLRKYIGRPRFTPEAHERTSVPGVATGLAVTGLGGDVLYIEATAVDGEPGLTLTGQLGDVMKESAQIALSYVRAHAADLGIEDVSVLDRRIHVHVPAGAIPKDGPSAGVTMVTALTSLATGRPVRGDVGMTGEVTLNGRVLPIGGVKQKLLAAQRAGLTTVFVPGRNEPDLDDVPADVLEAIDVRPMVDVAALVREALEPTAGSAAVGDAGLDPQVADAA